MARKIQPRSKVPKPKRGQSSEDYWRERESRQRAENIRNEAKTAERINRIFQGMQDSIQQEIESFYQRYASKEGITMTEARGRVSRIDMEQYERLAKKYVEAAHHGDEDLAFSQEANDQMRLYNAAMRINRLEMLKARCGIRAMEGYRDTERLINENLEERAYSEYRRLAGILGNSVQFNENMVRAIVNASYQNATWSQRLWNHQASLSSQIGTQLASGILAGKSSTVLAREIQKLTGGSTYACQRLMRTELRRVQTEAAVQSMTDNGVTEYKYLVANGVNPCEECLALDGQVFKLSEMNVGHNAPPIHPQCVLPGTKIIAPGMEAIMRSEYSGDVVEIGTASGARLSVTPNHIVLTERGWIRAKNIVKGDKVIHYTGRGEHGVEVHPANDDCIPAVEELFTAFVKAGSVSALGVPASPVDFKGDVVPQSKVDVVFINSQLRDEVDASVSKHGGYGPFIRALVIGERGLDTESPLNKALIWYGLAADGIMSRLSERGIFLRSSIRCADLVRFRTTADYNARLLQVSTDNGSTDVVSIGKSIFTNSRLVISNDNLEDVSGQFNGGVRRNSELNSVLDQDALNCFGSFMDDVCNVTKIFAGIVQFDDVVDVTSRFYSGHVYDTSCMSTLYTANGIITSNCHCATAPYVDEAKWQRWLDGPAQAGVPWAEFEGDGNMAKAPAPFAPASGAPAFKPAKSIEEAEQFANQFISGGYKSLVNYKGVDLKYANEFNRAFNDVLSQYDPKYKLRSIQPMNMRDKRFKGSTADAAYQWGMNDLYFNKGFFKSQKEFNKHLAQYNDLMGKVLPSIDSLIESYKGQTGFAAGKQLAYAEALKASERSNVSNADPYGTMIHELGHYLDDQIFRKEMKNRGFDLSASHSSYSRKISGYATASTQEYVAESFLAYWKGEIDKLDPELVKIFRETRKK